MHPLIFQSDFGMGDGAVSAMHGVAYSVSPSIDIFDLTHGIEPYNIWDASYRLVQTLSYWPEGAVFVSVVDPGVGSDRQSIVARTANNRFVVTPDNGTLTHIEQKVGISQIRIIDEARNRRPDSEQSYTFYGRDVYAFTGARLASGMISFEQVGPEVGMDALLVLPTMPPTAGTTRVGGTIDVLDVRFGSLWTNIPKGLLEPLHIGFGERVEVTIQNDTRTVYSNTMAYAKSFADVYIGEPLLYVNSLDCLAIAINQGSFSRCYNVGTGNHWRVSIVKDTRGQTQRLP